MPFSNQKKYMISLLSSGYCANPACRKHLLENDKMIGEFCHIEGEKEGSARYNSNQTEVERNEHQNAIMLCANCHTLVDKDETTHTTLILHSWKLDRVANDLNNIGACFSEESFSEEALSIYNKLAIEYENENRYKDSAKQYIGSGLIYARKGDYVLFIIS